MSNHATGAAKASDERGPAVIKRLLQLLRLVPAALEREHLRWALREIPPLHPDVPYIVRRINELETS